jgi:hypothetical protein
MAEGLQSEGTASIWPFLSTKSKDNATSDLLSACVYRKPNPHIVVVKAAEESRVTRCPQRAGEDEMQGLSHKRPGRPPGFMREY